MANIARVINFPVPDVALKEPRVADLEGGYTRIANELLGRVRQGGVNSVTAFRSGNVPVMR